MKNPSFAALAEAVGIRGIRIEDPAEVQSELQRAFTSNGPVVVDVVTDPNALSMPPKATFEQAKGFALSMGKMILAGDGGEVIAEMKTNVRNLL